MNEQQKKIVAIVATYNGAGWISKALLSLQCSEVSVSIIVVDNASTDETVAIIQNGFRDITLIRMPANLGFGRANNIGLQHALKNNAGYVLLLNQDACLSPDTVKILVEIADRHPDFGILSPLQLEYDGDELEPSFFAFINTNRRFMSDILQGKPQEIYEVEFVNAAIWLVTRPAIEKIGGFDPIFSMYGEDNDYCCRARFHGCKIGITPKAIGHHQASSIDLAAMSFSRQYLKLTSQLLFLLKRPDRIFTRSCIGVLIAWSKRLLVHSIDGEMKGLCATMLAMATAFFRLPSVYKHYLKCKQQGKSWL